MEHTHHCSRVNECVLRLRSVHGSASDLQCSPELVLSNKITNYEISSVGDSLLVNA